MGIWNTGSSWDDWDEDEQDERDVDPATKAERDALRDAALERATRDVRLVKLLHLGLVLFGALIFVVALLLI